MVGLGISAVGAISTYAVLRAKVSRLELDFSSHVAHDDRVHEREQNHHLLKHTECNTKINSGFKRLDDIGEKVTILERDTVNLLTMAKAEEKFVSKMELQLHLKNIELSTAHTDRTVGNMSKTMDIILGKLESISSQIRKENNERV